MADVDGLLDLVMACDVALSESDDVTSRRSQPRERYIKKMDGWRWPAPTFTFYFFCINIRLQFANSDIV